MRDAQNRSFRNSLGRHLADCLQPATHLFPYLYLFWVRGGSAWARNTNKRNTCNWIRAGGELGPFLQSFSDLFSLILHIHQAITSVLGWERRMTPVYSTRNHLWLSKFIPCSCKSSVSHLDKLYTCCKGFHCNKEVCFLSMVFYPIVSRSFSYILTWGQGASERKGLKIWTCLQIKIVKLL